MYRYDEWADVISELDANADLPRREQDFIISLVEEKPRYLSQRQVEWLEDLQRRYLV